MLITLSVMAKEPATPAPVPLPSKPIPITIVSQDGFNLLIEEQIDTHNVIVKQTSPAHNWFAGTFTNLPTDKEVTIGLSMAGNDTKGNVGNVNKWEGLRPVMTYADPAKYETYEWFAKDDRGCWVSGDPFKQGNAKFAGTGKVPEQMVIPKDVADKFLSQDGNYWQAWREIDNTVINKKLNIYSIKYKFDKPAATIAMRIPFTYTYMQEYIMRLKQSKIQGVVVDDIGTSTLGRSIQIIRISPTGEKNDAQLNSTVLIYAREHGSEPDGSWAIIGIINDTCSGKLVNGKVNLIMIPMLDADSASTSTIRTGDFFSHSDYSKEALQYALYIIDKWIDRNCRLDMCINLHNVECNEVPKNLSCPFMNINNEKEVIQFNKNLFARVTEEGYSVNTPTGDTHGVQGLRLMGWCWRRFHSFDLTFELNSRAPESRLSIAQLQKLGSCLRDEASMYIQSPEFQAYKNDIDRWMEYRKVEREKWWKFTGRTPATRNATDIFGLGY